MKVAKVVLLALVTGSIAGCATSAVQDGAVLGGTLGAGLGAVVGNQSGNTGEGALIGAGLGALAGALVGDQYEKAPTTTYRKQPVQATPVASGPNGHWEMRKVRAASGEVYEQRIWVPNY